MFENSVPFIMNRGEVDEGNRSCVLFDGAIV
jgi:hypothetical protein